MKPNFFQRHLKSIVFMAGIFLVVKLLSSCFQSKTMLEITHSAKVTRENLTVKVESTGEVKPSNRVEMKSPIGGRVEEVLVKEGDLVTQGQVVAWMSSTERAALLDAARAQGAEILKRWQDAYKPAPLIAPLDGMVIVRAVEPGQTVTTTEPIIVLADRLIVQALVDETDLAKIKLEQNTQIQLDAYPDKTIRGKVDHIGYESQLVNNVNMYAVDILPDPMPECAASKEKASAACANQWILQAFRSGMTASITFFVMDRHGILVLPSEAVAEWPRRLPKPEGAQFAVYKKSFTGQLVPLPIEIGESDGQRTEILKGLQENMEVQVVRKKESSSKGAFSPAGNRRPERKNAAS